MIVAYRIDVKKAILTNH